MKLREYVRPDCVVQGLSSRGIRDTIHEIVQRLYESRVIDDPAAVESRLVEREEAHSTVLDHGVAVPHATVRGIEGPLVAVGVAPEGIAFGAQAEEATRVFFITLSPPERAGEHIKLLARIARLAHHPGLVERLVRAETPDALLDDLGRIDAEHV